MLAWLATIEAVAETAQKSLQAFAHRGNGLDIHVSSPSRVVLEGLIGTNVPKT
jgi:hypothetical protein